MADDIASVELAGGAEKTAAAKPEALEPGAYSTTGRGHEIETLPQEGEQGHKALSRKGRRDRDTPNTSPVGSNERDRKWVTRRPPGKGSEGIIESKGPVEANVTCQQLEGSHQKDSKVSQMTLATETDTHLGPYIWRPVLSSRSRPIFVLGTIRRRGVVGAWERDLAVGDADEGTQSHG